MDDDLTRTTADVVRARIAALLAPDAATAPRLGTVVLEPHQRAAVARITAAIREFGGALLADETGLGKTFVALAIARDAARPLVVAPAALRDMWHDAASSAQVAIAFVSSEALSRRRTRPSEDPDLVIVDESHHFRNQATARHRALAALTARARVLLLSATPVHNSASDLTALLSLFLGARASTLDPAWMSRCIVRRSPKDVPAARLPYVPKPEPLRIDHDERHLDAILGLPPPLPPADGGDGGVLLVYSLLRQWASTRAALAEALRRRLARATALLAALETGRHPSATELAAWSFAEGAVQLAFPELVIEEARRVSAASDLAAAVRAHAGCVRALLDDLGTTTNPDLQRAAHISALRSTHRGAKIVVFSQYAESVSAMFRLLAREPGIAALTADGGQVAGGTLARGEVLARFAPRAQRVAPRRRVDSVDLLLTTDLLSEGVNLQDASVIVHLDLPWTPARLDQRVGRIARLGSSHERVAVYAMLPPAGAERIVGVEQRLREKLRVASRMVGVAATIIPSLTLAGAGGDASGPHLEPARRSPAESTEAIQAVLADWCARPPVGASDRTCGPAAPKEWARPVVAAVEGTRRGFIAVVGDVMWPRLIADVGTGPTDDPEAVLAALREASGPGAALEDGDLRGALDGVGRWSARHRLHHELSVDGAMRARARRSVADRIAAITRRAPRHLRPAIAALAATARRTVTAHYGVGAERVLGELAESSMPDEAWLRAVGTFGEVHGAGGPPEAANEPLLALLVFVDPARRVAAPGRER